MLTEGNEAVRGSKGRPWLFPQYLGKPSWLSGPGEGGREKGGGPHLQQQLQAATESVQLSARVCHRLPAPIALEDGGDSSCGEGGGHQTSGSEGSEEEAPKTPRVSPSSVPEILSGHTHFSGPW